MVGGSETPVPLLQAQASIIQDRVVQSWVKITRG